MGCARCEVGIREVSSGRMIHRDRSAEDALAKFPRLKRINAVGNDVFVRPAQESTGHGLVLVDDLARTALGNLARDGRAPVVIVETSPGKYPVWVCGPGETSDAGRAEIARGLVHEYGGDPASTTAHHYARLAGFTNRKADYRDAQGLHPFARLRAASGRAARDGVRLLGDAAQELETRSRAPSCIQMPAVEPTRDDTPDALQQALEICRTHLRELAERRSDRSQCDFVAAVRLVHRGYAPAAIRECLRQASPDLERRKRGHVEDYVQATVEAAVKFHTLARERIGRARDSEEPER
jgi:hypothetical protein